ncbi:MAG: hypothetical protein RL329_3501, partial [Bacteroidota bacterium]
KKKARRNANIRRADGFAPISSFKPWSQPVGETRVADKLPLCTKEF